ncbi:MAG: YHS domain-containing (seleno)protein [Tateyamaria sp.]|uniref:YHS domain-containing (seleno)protein n=1 Tax=Tateyamaria sp. TaxID=1929288 RepID=UPI00329D1814
MSAKINRRGFLNATLALGALAALPTAAFAKSISRFSLSKSGFALKGYDTTAYFQAGKPTNGTDATTVTYKGAKWRFATAQDAALFQANPEAYEPQFGGYCTRAMSLRKEVPGDPEVWRLHNGKLYVFFAPVGGKHFDKGEDAMIALAQKHWDTLTKVS